MIILYPVTFVSEQKLSNTHFRVFYFISPVFLLSPHYKNEPALTALLRIFTHKWNTNLQMDNGGWDKTIKSTLYGNFMDQTLMQAKWRLIRQRTLENPIWYRHQFAMNLLQLKSTYKHIWDSKWKGHSWWRQTYVHCRQ